MSIFKNATQISIPDSMIDTTSWISDEELIEALFIKDAVDTINDKIKIDSSPVKIKYSVPEPELFTNHFHEVLEVAA